MATKSVHINSTTGKVVNANFWTDHADEIADAAAAGVGSVVTVNGEQPDAEGNVQLDAADVGAASTAALSALTSSVDAKAASGISIAGTQSIAGGGDLTGNRTFSLVNDSTTPGANKVYGTDGSGAKGWKDDPSGVSDPAAAIHAASSKSTPADTDELALVNTEASNALAKLTWSNLKARLKAYFDGFYSTFSGAYADLTGKPTLGNAAALNVGSGSGTVCAGNDGRLSDARTPTAHQHSAEDMTSGTLPAARLPAPGSTTLGGVKRNAGSSGQFVNGIDANGALTFDTPAGGSGGINVQDFTTNGTWTKPSGIKMVRVILIGQGGNGGTGAAGIHGKGGGAGQLIEVEIPGDVFGETESVTFSAGNVSFAWLTAEKGVDGLNAESGGSGDASSGFSLVTTNPGSAGSDSDNAFIQHIGPTGGGAGGVGSGGSGPGKTGVGIEIGSGIKTGALGGDSYGNGADGGSLGVYGLGGGGGAVGYDNGVDVNNPGGNGGAGGNYGGGGGGGGGSTGGAACGSGGAGGAAFCRVISYL